MKRYALQVITLTALLSMVGLAQTPQTPPPAQTPPKMQDMKVVGCIVKALKPNSYLLERAVDPAKKDDTPRAFRIQALMEDPDFESQVNARVEMTGQAEIKQVPTPPPGGKVDEKDLPVFMVKSFQRVADTCSY
jgi:hypothetical protein